MADPDDWADEGGLIHETPRQTKVFRTAGRNPIRIVSRANGNVDGFDAEQGFRELRYVSHKGFRVEEPLGFLDGSSERHHYGTLFTRFVKGSIALGPDEIKTLPPENRIRIASSITDLLREMHRSDIVHMHPHNGNFRYLPESGQIVLIDTAYMFGSKAEEEKLHKFLYFLLTANGRSTGSYGWHCLVGKTKLVEDTEIPNLMRRYMQEMSVEDYNSLIKLKDPLDYSLTLSGAGREEFCSEYVSSEDEAIDYMMRRMDFMQKCLTTRLHGG